MVDGHVQFPDVRIEYEHPDGRRSVEDIEVVTPRRPPNRLAAA
jgi:hypothetical protein